MQAEQEQATEIPKVLSVSGPDSVAMLMAALERGQRPATVVFADVSAREMRLEGVVRKLIDAGWRALEGKSCWHPMLSDAIAVAKKEVRS
jgi:hypothetical protein